MLGTGQSIGGVAASAGSDLAAFFGTIASLLGVLAFAKQVIPREAWYALDDIFRRFRRYFSLYSYATIQEVAGHGVNEIYEEAALYVTELVRKRPPRKLDLSRSKNAAAASFGLVSGEGIRDTFQGVVFLWTHYEDERKNADSYTYYRIGVSGEVKRYYQLRLLKRHQELVQKYLDHVGARAKILRHQRRERMMFTNEKQEGYYSFSRSKAWRGVAFKHPSTFESIAMDSKLKNRIMDDLTLFMSAEGFYKRVGRAWKRGYLLYGPPGTGKSSLIAAIANFTGYDVYDLELTEVSRNAQLRKLLMTVPSKSIIVIEDIDCSIELKKRGKAAKSSEEEKGKKKEDDEASKVTLSGLLNFTDGLWSCCGDERIIIFTTNFKEKIDPALLRSGRMDFHIHMGYCCLDAFKVLALTHLGVEEHETFEEIAKLLPPADGGVEVTPADVAEALVQKRDLGAEAALQDFVEALKDPQSKLREKKKSQQEEEEKENAEAPEEKKAEAEDGWLGMSG